MKRSIVLFLCLVLFALCLSGCGLGSGREYLNDIVIPLQSRQAKVIIREWKFLLGSGAEIYYKDSNGKVLLGQVSGGDDGHCPFKEGLYSVEVKDNELIIEVGRRMDAGIIWSTETFTLPNN